MSKDNIVIFTLIYTYYLYNFIMSSLILLVAMIGAIILTLNNEVNLKKQFYFKQNQKHIFNSLILKKQHRFKIDI